MEGYVSTRRLHLIKVVSLVAAIFFAGLLIWTVYGWFSGMSFGGHTIPLWTILISFGCLILLSSLTEFAGELEDGKKGIPKPWNLREFVSSFLRNL